MASFLNVTVGETKTARGIRLTIREDGEAAWLSGKWLDLGPDHAVLWVDGKASFTRGDGRKLGLGEFPAWIVRGTGKHPCMAVMFNAAQFSGGTVEIVGAKGERQTFPVH